MLPIIIECGTCGAPIDLEYEKEVTEDWQYATTCKACGQYQFGFLILNLIDGESPIDKLIFRRV